MCGTDETSFIELQKTLEKLNVIDEEHIQSVEEPQTSFIDSVPEKIDLEKIISDQPDPKKLCLSGYGIDTPSDMKIVANALKNNTVLILLSRLIRFSQIHNTVNVLSLL